METCPATRVVDVPRYRYEVEREGEVGLGLAEFAEHGVDRVEGSVDLLPHLIGDERCQCQHRYHTARILSTSSITTSRREQDNYLCTREDNLAGYKNEEHNLGLDHTIDQPREQLYSC